MDAKAPTCATDTPINRQPWLGKLLRPHTPAVAGSATKPTKLMITWQSHCCDASLPLGIMIQELEYAYKVHG